MGGLAFLVERGYRELKGSLERLVPRSLGLRRGTFVLVWMERVEGYLLMEGGRTHGYGSR
jgi:hypothetical protein